MYRFPLFAYLLSFLMTTPSFAADPRDKFEARVYKNATGQTLPYRLLKPVDYDAKKSYPLVIFLHGAGERGNDNAAQLKHGMGDFASDEIMAKYPAFVVAPQCPNGKKWVEVDWSLDKHDSPAQASDALGLTMEIIDSLGKEFSLDKNRLYITGLSMGGYGTWDALGRYPDRFAAGAPICGGGDPKDAPKFKHIPVWAFHGDQDTAVKVGRSREMIAALEAVGAKPKYTEYPGVGHDSWSATYRNPEFYAWMFGQVKGK